VQFPLASVVALDACHKAVPCAWGIMSNEQETTVAKFLQAVKDNTLAVLPEWQPGCFFIDDAATLANAIRCAGCATVAG
jgi:hypothetical protein